MSVREWQRERERMTEQEWGREREIGPLEVSNVRHKSCSLFLHVRHCSPQVPSSRCANFLFCFTRVYQLQVTVFLVSVDSAAVPGLTWNGLQWLVWKEMDWVTILSRNYGLQWLIWIDMDWHTVTSLKKWTTVTNLTDLYLSAGIQNVVIDICLTASTSTMQGGSIPWSTSGNLTPW